MVGEHLGDIASRREQPGGWVSAAGVYFRSYFINSIITLDGRLRHPSPIVALVERMLDLHKRLADAKTGHEKTLFSRQIEATDRQIDALVYELYGLSEEEIAIVEEAAR